VNRVGFSRVELSGSIALFGFFDEYTKESLMFDTDAELEMHINREMLRGASEITEDMLQIDLLNAAGVIRYPGAATSLATLSGETGAVTEVDYEDIMRLGIDLDNNRCPKKTKMLTGSTLTDTKTINSARPMFIGSELQPTLMAMKDLHNNPAFVPVRHYAAQGTVTNPNTFHGEIGAIDTFRIIVVPEMLHKAGVGASVTNNAGYRATAGKYDAFPMLVVGDQSFSAIGFQTDGKKPKFNIIHKKPSEETADRNEPYGQTGFMSIHWYHGTLIERDERIACIWTVAKL
jgi:N4-gp56 family major capsid protein